MYIHVHTCTYMYIYVHAFRMFVWWFWNDLMMILGWFWYDFGMITEAGLPAGVDVYQSIDWLGFSKGLDADGGALVEPNLVLRHRFFHLEIDIASKTVRRRKWAENRPPKGPQNSKKSIFGGSFYRSLKKCFVFFFVDGFGALPKVKTLHSAAEGCQY